MRNNSSVNNKRSKKVRCNNQNSIEFSCRALSKTSPTTILPRLTGPQSLHLYVFDLHIFVKTHQVDGITIRVSQNDFLGAKLPGEVAGVYK